VTGLWYAVDGDGCDLATGRPPSGRGWASPAAALAASPVMAWPVAVAGDDGRRLGLAAALGPGGQAVEALLGSVAAPAVDADVGALLPFTPAGPVELPVSVVALGAAVEAAAAVDRSWLEAVDRVRDAPRRALVAAGRAGDMDAAVHAAMLLAAEWLDPADDADVDAHVASGARLWLLTGAVVSALAGSDPDPFRPWASLVAAGWWPVGPSGGRLVVSR
jgi:hypothetical protein